MYSRKIRLIGFLILSLALVGCVPATQVTETPALTPTVPASGDKIGGYAELLDALRREGATVEPAGEVEQPFFSVTGQAIEIDGAPVQVFEYEDEAAREAESAEISPDGATVGGSFISWIDRPNFWAQGRLIVLYVGADEAMVSLLTQVLGDPIAQGETLPSYAAVAAEQALSESLGVLVEEISLVSYERQEWPDACLGLARTDEICAQVITPGWRVVLRVGGQEYVFRTDQNGEVVRQEGMDEASESDEPMIVARGEFVGVGGHAGTGTASVVQLPDGSAVLRLEGFSVTAGPDLYVYLVSAAEPASSGDFGETLDLGLLESNEGDQEYAIPADADLSQYYSAVIYCLAYDVLFARATLAK